MAQHCHVCNSNIVCAKSRGHYYCKSDFIKSTQEHVFKFIKQYQLIREGETVGIGISGGKDSVVLGHILKEYMKSKTNPMVLLAIDEGIVGYRDHSLVAVHKTAQLLDLPLEQLSYAELFEGFTMDKVVSKTGGKRSCSYCGVFRRDALTAAGKKRQVDIIATGHNREDLLETYFLNLFRGDTDRIRRTTAPRTTDSAHGIARIKPFFTLSQRDIVLYAELVGLDYFSVECPYSLLAFRGVIRTFLIQIDDFTLHTAVNGLICEETGSETMSTYSCRKCGGISSHEVCAKCTMLHELKTLL